MLSRIHWFVPHPPPAHCSVKPNGNYQQRRSRHDHQQLHTQQDRHIKLVAQSKCLPPVSHRGTSGLRMEQRPSAWREAQLTAGSNFLPPASRKGAVMTTDSRALSPIIVASQLEPSDCSSSRVRLPMAYSGAPWLAIVTHSKRMESCTHGHLFPREAHGEAVTARSRQTGHAQHENEALHAQTVSYQAQCTVRPLTADSAAPQTACGTPSKQSRPYTRGKGFIIRSLMLWQICAERQPLGGKLHETGHTAGTSQSRPHSHGLWRRRLPCLKTSLGVCILALDRISEQAPTNATGHLRPSITKQRLESSLCWLGAEA